MRPHLDLWIAGLATQPQHPTSEGDPLLQALRPHTHDLAGTQGGGDGAVVTALLSQFERFFARDRHGLGLAQEDE
ncbi:MAG: hypothetical protein M3450_03480, partial [Actinomycetota bacterium]|nr:hypothetical protein [Actinomycetota bacterium]